MRGDQVELGNADLVQAVMAGPHSLILTWAGRPAIGVDEARGEIAPSTSCGKKQHLEKKPVRIAVMDGDRATGRAGSAMLFQRAPDPSWRG